MIDHDDGLVYGSTRYPKPVSTLSYNSQGLLVPTRNPPGKSHGLPNSQADFLILAYNHPGLEGEFQRLGLWYIVNSNTPRL